MRVFLIRFFCLILTVSCLEGCKKKEAPPQAVPVVHGKTLKMEDVRMSTAFSGFIEAAATVQIIPRVTGYIESRNFKEGETVKENQILFEIEKDTYVADKLSAEANLKKAEASLTQTQNDYKRAEKLVRNGDIPRSTYDQQKAAYEAAMGSVQQAKASLKIAELNLGYATMRAPVSGKISDTTFERGNYITPATGPLTQLVVTDPVRVSFGVSNGLIAELRDEALEKADDIKQTVKARIRFENGKYYEKDGKIYFVDVLVDRVTDSLKVKVEFPNEEGILIPGQYVSVILEAIHPKKGIVIPRSAMLTDKSGPYVMVYKDGVANVARIKTGQETTQTVYVKTGLKEGDVMITDGLQKIRPEGKVTVVLEEDKPVKEDESSDITLPANIPEE